MPDDLVLKQLIASAQVLGIQNDSSLPAADRQILRIADEQKRGLSATEIHQICSDSNVDAQVTEHLQNKANQLVQQARDFLLREQPHLVQPGGALFPSERAEACWRDCFHFLRISLYAVAAGESNFTDPSGLNAMEELYSILKVPVPALLIALTHLRDLACEAYSRERSNHDEDLLRSALNHLIKKMSAFQLDHDQWS